MDVITCHCFVFSANYLLTFCQTRSQRLQRKWQLPSCSPSLSGWGFYNVTTQQPLLHWEDSFDISEAWSYKLLSNQLIPIKNRTRIADMPANVLYSGCETKFLPATGKLLPASSDLRSERTTSMRCSHPGEGKKLLFSNQSWPRLASVKLSITGYKMPACTNRDRTPSSSSSSRVIPQLKEECYMVFIGVIRFSITYREQQLIVIINTPVILCNSVRQAV